MSTVFCLNTCRAVYNHDIAKAEMEISKTELQPSNKLHVNQEEEL